VCVQRASKLGQVNGLNCALITRTIAQKQSIKVFVMLRPSAVLVSAAVISLSSLAAGQDPQPPSVQTPSVNADPANPEVVILKPAQAPAGQQQFKPALRAVDLESRPKLTTQTRMRLIQLVDAEFAHTRKYLPLGAKDIEVTPEGEVKPGDAQLFQMMQAYGAAAKVGDKVQVTDIRFHDKSIIFEINGGAKKKSKWYQHIQISGMGGTTAPMDESQSRATGAAVTLHFNKDVPEMNADELEKLISPVLDFSVKSAAEVYVETLPPKLREAIKKHEVLVGMNRDMVLMAMDRPRHKFREKDKEGRDYEEWLYGTPPHDVVLVRFIGNEVTEVKIAKVDGRTEVKTVKEVNVTDGVVSLASLKASDSPEDAARAPQEQQQPTQRPTLKRPDEVNDVSVKPKTSADDGSSRDPEPQWGEKTNPGNGQTPSQDQQKPPQ
jgi:hypothetical protein